MQANFKTVVILGSMAIAFFSRCNTDVDLTAPYMSIPVVFGLLDAEADTQWVRINRTWLGEGDQTDAALIADSSEYSSSRLEAQFVEVINGVDGRVFTLQDTLLQNKSEDGVFFAPEHKAYFAPTRVTDEMNLNPDAQYRLELVIDDTTEVEALTNMIAVTIGNITRPPMGIDNIRFGFASVGSSNVTYPNYTFKWYSTPGASRYDAIVRVHFIEHYWADDYQTILDSSRTRMIEIPVGSEDPNNDDGGELIKKIFGGYTFFSNLSTRLIKSPRITRELGVWDEDSQIARAFDFVLIVANEQLAIYLDINSPVTGIIQERPEYTNINGGLGLWASRTTQGVFGIGYTTDTIEHLQEGDETAELNFCTPNPFSDYTCN
ncbi:MAG: hypothetical protein COA49_01725 [Bacteroidetes bacterium]|nr:MAG: hypothetical protein COA49_01725 [Bacteroidota bacterium]